MLSLFGFVFSFFCVVLFVLSLRLPKFVEHLLVVLGVQLLNFLLVGRVFADSKRDSFGFFALDISLFLIQILSILRAELNCKRFAP